VHPGIGHLYSDNSIYIVCGNGSEVRSFQEIHQGIDIYMEYDDASFFFLPKRGHPSAHGV